ncbi:hypothetical protein O1M54_00860 [Streptomyces diastatochromogenes]|nr:hypothetical protein [Streptomyces diastatochromogenes]
MTAQPDSTLGTLADAVLPVPSAHTSQFGGSLFEQGALLLFDAVVMALAADTEGAYKVGDVHFPDGEVGLCRTRLTVGAAGAPATWGGAGARWSLGL